MPKPRDYPDQTRVLALLWRPAEEPSARSGLTVSRIVEAAVAIADGGGLGALSMRAIAERLGVGTMSLYTYVPGRDELLPLMQEAVTAELAPIVPERGSWRDQLASMARGYWDLYAAHPWLLDVPLTRPVLGPNGYDRAERELAAVDGIGLDELEMNAAVDLVRTHVAGTALRARDIRRDAERSGMSDDEWWYAVAPLLERFLATRSYPVLSRVGAAIAAPHTDPRHDLEFGLARILDGVESLVEARRSSDAQAG